MPTVADRLVANEQMLTAAWGDDIPQLTPAHRAAADLVADRVASGLDPTPGVHVHYLTSLASAHRGTGEARYAKAAAVLFDAWLTREPERPWRPGPGYNALDIPHTLGDTECVGWFGVLPRFVSNPAFPDDLVERLVDSARDKLNYLIDHLHEARNIRMSQCDALVTESIRLDFLPDAKRWREVGLPALNDCFHRQFHPDGASIEATAWYHYICMNMALRFWRLAKARPDLGLRPLTPEHLGRTMDYNVALVEPAGQQTRIGDCIGVIGTIEQVLARRAVVRRELGLDDAPPPLAQVFPDAKQALFRDGWGPDSTYVTFDATRRMGYHWHPGRNSVQLQFRGQNLVTDPGRMGYSDTPHRHWAVSTRAHSTMNLNGWDQASSEPSFRHRSAPGYEIVDSLYDGGYWEMSPIGGHKHGVYAEHHRTLVWVRGRFLVVIDNLYHTQEEGAKPAVELNWQLGPGDAEIVRDDPASGLHLRSRHGQATLHLLTALRPAGMKAEIFKGSESPCAGWVANDSDRPAPAPWLRQRVESFDLWNADCATVLLPVDRSDAAVPRVESAHDPANKRLGRFVLRWPDGSSDTFCWTRRLEVALLQAGVPSDASLLHVHADRNGKLLGGLVWEGSFFEPYTGEVRQQPETFALRPTGG